MLFSCWIFVIYSSDEAEILFFLSILKLSLEEFLYVCVNEIDAN